MELDMSIAFALYLVGFLYASVGHGGASGAGMGVFIYEFESI